MSATVIANSEHLDMLREKINEILADNPNLDFRSRSDYIAEMKNENMQFTIVGLSLCLIILLIGILNFVNSTMTNIISRKYEFAILQAVGMTAKQSSNMLLLESLYFVMITGAIFISLGYAASYALVHMLTDNTAAYTYRFTVLPLLVSFPPLFLIAVILPRRLYKMISRNSVVERLREIS